MCFKWNNNRRENITITPLPRTFNMYCMQIPRANALWHDPFDVTPIISALIWCMLHFCFFNDWHHLLLFSRYKISFVCVQLTIEFKGKPQNVLQEMKSFTHIVILFVNWCMQCWLLEDKVVFEFFLYHQQIVFT